MLLQRCSTAIAASGFHVHKNPAQRVSPQVVPIPRLVATGRAVRKCNVSTTVGESLVDCASSHGAVKEGDGAVREGRATWKSNVSTTVGESLVDCASSHRAVKEGDGAVKESDGAVREGDGAVREGDGAVREGDGAHGAPLVEALRECAEMDAAAFHFPGHRRGAGAPAAMAALVGLEAFAADLPELPELDNLHAAEGVILEAQNRAALLFRAEQTWFLVNGSTCGIQAAVMAACAPGDHLVLPRNVHMSAVSAMVLSGALPRYVTPVADTAWGVAHGVRATDVDTAIRDVQGAGGRVGAVLVVSPTYFGICSDIADIARVCHSHNIPLIVDEAHGAHFRFHRLLPETALAQGADVAVQSTHKVLGSLTQSAMLHAQGERIDRERLAQCLQMLQSSSPSYLLLASLDASRAHMEADCGVDDLQSSAIDAALSLASMLRQSLQALPGLSVLDVPSGAAGIDPLRITVGLWELGLTGFEADDILRLEHGVVAELPSLRSITFAISAGSSRRDAVRLIDSFAALSARYSSEACSSVFVAPEPVWEKQVMALSPREAFYSRSEKVLAQDAVGRASAELLCPYPPGIPVVTPGEIITQQAVDCIRAVLAQGGVVSGASDESFRFARVVVSNS